MNNRTKRRKRLSQEEWEAHLNRWRKSGESQALYCRRNKINPATFSRQACLSQTPGASQDLVQLPVIPSLMSQSGMLEFQIKNPGRQSIKLQVDLSDEDTITWRLTR